MGRGIIIISAVVAVLLIGGAAVYRHVRAGRVGVPVTKPASASPVPVAAGVKSHARRIRLVQVDGEVKINRGGRGWQSARAGDELRDEDAIRTGGGGNALLEFGDHATVRMPARSEFSVAQISEHLARVRLEQGRMAAAVRGGDGSRLQVGFRGSQAVAEASQGEFSAITDGRGLVSVAASAGQVRLSAQRGTVDIVAGQQSVIQGDEAPSPPSRIPSSLFLKVGRPAPAGADGVMLHGNTEPGALVSVNGRDVVVGKQGVFEARVTVKEGTNEIVINAEDALGRRETARQSYLVPGGGGQATAQRDKPTKPTSSDDMESKVTW